MKTIKNKLLTHKGFIIIVIVIVTSLILNYFFYDNNAIVIMVVFFVVGCFFSIAKSQKGIIKSFEISREYILLLIATLMGVYLALHLNNVELEKERKKQVVVYLNSGIELSKFITALNIHLLENLKDTLHDEHSSSVRDYPMLAPDLITSIINKDLILQETSDIYQKNYCILSFEMKRVYKAVKVSDVSYREKIYNMNVYNIYLRRAHDLNYLEIEYLNKEIPYDSLIISCDHDLSAMMNELSKLTN